MTEFEKAIATADAKPELVTEAYSVRGFDRPLTYNEMKAAFMDGKFLYTGAVKTLHECAVNRGDDHLAALTAIALDYHNEVDSASKNDSAERLQNLKEVAHIYEYHNDERRLDSLINSKSKGFEYGD